MKRFITWLAIFLMTIPGLSSKSFAISIPDELKLADEFMNKIQQQQVILDDPVATHLINAVGRHILERLSAQPFNYSFYLIDDGTFNAFASPGANIFIHRGLITALSSTDELAGIMAHEIAHAVSRHVSQSIDRSKLVNMGTMAGVLAGIIVGSAGGGGDAAQALTMGSMAAGYSSMLTYTRDNETEADQKAFTLLQQTCFSPQGLLVSLNKLRDADYMGIEGIPDYFKTHPGTGSRISHLSGLLSDYTHDPSGISCPDTYNYDMVKYRVMGLYEPVNESIRTIDSKIVQDPSNPALYYGLGLLYARENRRNQAIAQLQKALSYNLMDPLILLELGRIYILDGQYDKAMKILPGIQSDPVLGTTARYHLAVAQLESGDLASARQNLVQVTETASKSFPRAYYHLGEIMSRENRTALSHYYLGVYYDMIQDSKNAARHLKRALDEGLDDPDTKIAAEKRLERISTGRQPS
ncbi:MAG: M48 family metalloprotease [Desulfotignum sp.]|nr:M48 family metalloprotease [Desulfotignum sp.]